VRFVVLGAGGHSREVADLILACGHEVGGFQDDAATGLHRPTGLPIAGRWQELAGDAITVAVGDSAARERLYRSVGPALPFPVLIHPSACVSAHAHVGDGTQVMQNVVVNSAATVGENVILNVGCFIAHDCVVGAHSHIAPGVLMSGASSVGARCLVGAGAIILPGITVGDDCIIGAGAVVTRAVPAGETVSGVPARVHGEIR